MNAVKASVRRYWNWRSESYDTETSRENRHKWEAILKELVSVSSGGRALDIGTGRGPFAICLARAGFEVTAIDISERMLSHARAGARQEGLAIDFQTGDAEALNFEAHAFDVIVSRNLLWTLPHPERALREWWRVLKPGGTLVLSDGVWLNYTWQRLPHLALELLRSLFGKRNAMIPIRFFCSYAALQKSLPFYEGMRFEDASMLMQNVGFKDVRCYDPRCFDFNPYGPGRADDLRSFFISCARR